MSNKTQFINRTLDVMVQMALLEEAISGMVGVFVDRGYAPGGSDPITQEDIGTDLDLQQFISAISVIGEYQTFCNTLIDLPAPVATSRKTKLNIARKDI